MKTSPYKKQRIKNNEKIMSKHFANIKSIYCITDPIYHKKFQ